MATAAVISLDETRQAFAKTRARQELHAYLDRWLESVEANMPDDTPSLEALTQAVLARRQELTGKITEVLVAQRHAQGLHQRIMPCPHCQRLLPARPAPPRTVHTMVGEVSLSRPYFYCPDCQQGFAPLDEALQLSERRTQWDMQQAAARLAAEVPFETAQELFTQLTGLSLSDHTIHAVAGELSQELGVLEVSPTAAADGPARGGDGGGQDVAAHHGLGHRWGVCPDASGAGQGRGDWSPAHTGQAGRVAGGMEGGQGLSLLPGGSGADCPYVELVSRRWG